MTTDRLTGWRLILGWLAVLALSLALWVVLCALVVGILAVAGSPGLLLLVTAGVCCWWGLR